MYQWEIQIHDSPLSWIPEVTPGKFSQINPFLHDLPGVWKGVTISGITGRKNFITAGQLSTPKKHGTSQSWRTDTTLITFAIDSFLHIVYLKINIFCNNSWSLGKYRMTLTFKVYFDPFQTSHSMCKHGRTSSPSVPNTKWGQKVRKSHTSVRSVPKNTGNCHLHL